MIKKIIKYIRINEKMDDDIKNAMKKKDFENFGQFARYAFSQILKKIIGENNDNSN